jgi:hypothetical protein
VYLHVRNPVCVSNTRTLSVYFNWQARSTLSTHDKNDVSNVALANGFVVHRVVTDQIYAAGMRKPQLRRSVRACEAVRAPDQDW